MENKKRTLNLFLALIFSSIHFSINSHAATPVRLLTWWDYVSTDVLRKAEASGIKLVRPFKKIPGPSQSDYLDIFRSHPTDCIPYLWSTTIFSVVGPDKVSSLSELLELKKKNYSVAVIDDTFEVFSRALLDKKCPGVSKTNIFNWEGSSKCFDSLDNLVNLKSNDLKTSTADYLNKDHAAAYGWHGALKPLMNPSSKLEMYLPKSRPIIGIDYVCVINKPKIHKDTYNLVRLLTDMESTEMNVKSTGYFSPHKNHPKGVDPTFRKLYDNLMSLPPSEGPILLVQPPEAIHKKINTIFQKIRYEDK